MTSDEESPINCIQENRDTLLTVYKATICSELRMSHSEPRRRNDPLQDTADAYGGHGERRSELTDVTLILSEDGCMICGWRGHLNKAEYQHSRHPSCYQYSFVVHIRPCRILETGKWELEKNQETSYRTNHQRAEEVFWYLLKG